MDNTQLLLTDTRPPIAPVLGQQYKTRQGINVTVTFMNSLAVNGNEMVRYIANGDQAHVVTEIYKTGCYDRDGMLTPYDLVEQIDTEEVAS
jgi:hypothetical protein